MIAQQAKEWVRRYGIVLPLYILATLFTDADFMGDTVDYVSAIVRMSQGHNYFFWEFAHLTWRPFGWVVAQVFTPLTKLVVGDNPYANVTFQLIALSWLAGLLIVIATHSLVSRLYKQQWIANVVTIALIFSYGFLNHVQSGASYIPGLLFLVLGIYVLLRNREPERPLLIALLAGVTLASSVGLWVTYVLAVPAALVSPLFVFGFNRQRLRLVVFASVAFVVTIGFAYALVLVHIGIYNLTDFRAWMAASADAAYIPRGGVPRTVFSLARSFIHMGNDGILFKRFLTADPFNPVSLSELLRLSLWKLALFYVFLSSVIFNLVRGERGRWLLALLLFSMIPVLILALGLEGGAVDRYFPLYPFIFVVFAHSLSRNRPLSFLNLAAISFFVVAAITNVTVLATPVINHQQETAAARIREIQPHLKSGSIVITVNLRDDLVNFNRSFPLHPLNIDSDRPLRVGSVIAPGAEYVSQWREVFASGVLSVWKKGGDVWLSRRVLSPRPQPEWGWVEADDPRVSWTDLSPFFSQLEFGQLVGGEDGFMLVLPSPQNEQFLEQISNWEQMEKR